MRASCRRPSRSPTSPTSATRPPSSRRSTSPRWSKPAATTPRGRAPPAAEPLFDIAAREQPSGDTRAAGRALNPAAALDPATAETWRRLGDFRLNVLHDAKGAQRAYGAALYLDPQSPQSQS